MEVAVGMAVGIDVRGAVFGVVVTLVDELGEQLLW